MQELALGIDKRRKVVECEQYDRHAPETVRLQQDVRDKREPRPDPSGQITRERRLVRQRCARAADQSHPPSLHRQRAAARGPVPDEIKRSDGEQRTEQQHARRQVGKLQHAPGVGAARREER